MKNYFNSFVVVSVVFLLIELTIIFLPFCLMKEGNYHLLLPAFPWFLLIFALSGMGIFTLFFMLIQQEGKMNAEIDKANKDREERKGKLEIEHSQMEQSLSMRRGMERADKITTAIKDLASMLKDSKASNLPMNEQTDHIIEALKQHGENIRNLINEN